MGTLTAECPRLDAHCPHKLATSCRLTSTPSCCACADERVHSRLYRVYIDGVGYVQRGTRWQSYCWFCKAATDPPLEAAQTQIPHIPDQTEFIARWFEFHQGYRIAKQPDGTETHIAVIGEPFREVSPGFLPRTLDQLRAGRENDASRPENVFRRRRLTSEQDSPQQAHQTIEDALDDLLGNISDDDAEAETETETPATQLPDTRTPDTSMPRRRASTEALSRQPTETRLQRARDRITRVFGSREDVQRDDYESPLFTMYNRAEERYRQAEERRAAGDTPDPRLRNLNNLSRRERHELQEQILWGVLRDSRRSPRNQNGSVRSYTPAPTQRRREGDANGASPEQRVPSPPRNPPDESPSALRTSLNHLSDDLAALEATTSSIASARLALARQARPTLNPAASPSAQTLDEPSRPAPLSDAQMTLKLDCQVVCGYRGAGQVWECAGGTEPVSDV
ncbi:hypothetical protein GRF29_28g2359571 [Pseudopithomyces chartarum]|uniref:Uncharacterized protein n=1 Tax=Pseudopithomyces chartarum TaxID=1892770 RepID=A0AAN6M3X8_9PLEO|nr:hypothetical protein GRF29_28g2359571 [Pseudopithomyces chartarum]